MMYGLPDGHFPDFGLVCPQCSYRLAGLTSSRCPECGKEIDLEAYVPPGDFPTLIFAGKEVILTPGLAKRLRDARIHFILKRGAEEILGISNNPIFRTKARIGVIRTEYFEAVRIAAEEYVNPSSVELFAELDSAEDWTCENCKEENPDTFEVCWNCEQPRDSQCANSG